MTYLSKPLKLWFYCRDILPGVELKAQIEHVAPDDTFAAEKKTCYLLGKSADLECQEPATC